MNFNFPCCQKMHYHRSIKRYFSTLFLHNTCSQLEHCQITKLIILDLLHCLGPFAPFINIYTYKYTYFAPHKTHIYRPEK